MKILRRVRILLSIIVFVLISAVFLDIYHALPNYYALHNPTKIQFVPSLLQLLGTFCVLPGAAFLTFTICVLIFGRAYCSCFCAFGILMDGIDWIVRKVLKIYCKFYPKNQKKSERLGATPPWTKLRITCVAVAALSIAFGWTALLGLIDPYSLYGKIFGTLLVPIAADGVNQASTILCNVGYYGLSPVSDHVAVAMPAFGFSLIVLIGITIATALRGRLYCNTICPVGGFLGWLSKYALFHLTLNKDRCRGCRLCEFECKTHCINAKSMQLDYSRCVLCFNCANKCRQNAIRFEFAYKHLFQRKQKMTAVEDTQIAERQMASRPIDRRQFFKATPALAALFCTGNTPSPTSPDGSEPYVTLPDASPYGIRGDRPDKRLPAPPGAGTLKNFLTRCTACQLCVSACKNQVLKPSITEWGLAGFMQPVMDFRYGFCLEDCNLCTLVCPAGALRPLTTEQKNQTKIGTAIFRKELCVVTTDETDCSACGEHCPVAAIEMLPYKPEKHLYIPHIHDDVCIGCGACEHICPVEPHKALVIQGIKTHTVAKKFEDSMRLYVPQEDTKPVANPEPLDEPFPF